MAKISSPLTETFESLRKQFVAKEKLIKSSLILQKKGSESKRKRIEKKKFINYENKLEKKLSFLGTPIKKVGKRLGFLDSLKQFIVNLLLGFIAIRLLKYLPQLTKVFLQILKVGEFIINICGKLLNGLITFVDKGYQAADHAKQMVRSIGGEKAVNALESMNSQANSLLNSILIAGMLFSDFGGVGTASIASGKATDAAVDVVKDQVKKRAAQQTANAAARTAMGPLAAAGIVIGTGLLSSAIGEGAFQIKKLGKNLQTWAGGKITEASQDKNPVTRFLKKGFFGWLQATLGPAIWLLNGTGVLFDIVGAPFRYGIELIRSAFMKLNDDKKGLDEQNKNLGKFDARIRDGIREHFSILSPLFNFVGMKGVAGKLQTPGSFGSLYGENAAKDLGYYNGGLVIKKFAGGGYTRSIGDEDKKVEIPRTFDKEPSSLKPGSSVGGEHLIEKIFPSTDDGNKMDQYAYMVSSYNKMSSISSFGPLMGLTVKTILGDKVTDNDYNIASDSLSSFLMSGIYEENPQAYQQIYSNLNSNSFKSIVRGEVVKSLRDNLGQIENQLRVQLGLKTPEIVKEQNDMDCECPDESGGGGEVVAAEIPPEGKALLDAIAGAEARGYNIRYGGATFDSYKDHPRIRRPTPDGRSSDAAGRYQFLSTTWDPLAKKLGLKDFSPANQDRAAWQLAVDVYGYGVSGIVKGLRSDPIKVAYKLNGTWPSLPGGSQKNNATKGFLGRYNASVRQYQGSSGVSAAKISPSSPAANVDPCVCDPEIPSGDPGNVQAAGATAGGKISGYPITDTFGWSAWRGRKHGGIDIGVPSGKPIALNVPGIAGPPPQYEGGYGNFIDIQIPTLGNLYFRFAHMLKPPNYKPGQQIPANKIFGYVGSTGKSTGPHIHFEVNKSISFYGGDRDPTPYGKYISIGRETGGPTLSGGVRLLHKGEYVIDKDSVDLFGGVSFYSMINKVENEKQRTQKSSTLIQHLSKYTGRKIDQRAEVIVDNEEEDVVIMSPPVINRGSSFMSGGHSPNWEQDILEMRG